MRLSKSTLLLLTVLAAALLVRLIGLDHGLPFIYHPDEPALVRSAYGLRFGNLNPGHFDWPHFHYYLCFFIFEAFIKFRAGLQILNLRGLFESIWPLLWQDPAIFYFIARVVAALMGTATVFLTYLIGRHLFGKKVGLVGALFLAAVPLAVDQAHFALIDVPMAFWVALSFYFSILVLEKGKWWQYLLAGLFAGFAASTKYHGALVVVVIAAAALLRGIDLMGRIRPMLKELSKLLLAAVASAAAFFAGTPFALLDWETFTFKEDARGFLWQLENMKGHLGAEALNGWWFYTVTLVRGLGYAVLGLAVLGIIVLGVRGVLGVLKKRGGDWRKGILAIVFPLVYFLYVGSMSVVYGRFMIPILPMLCVLAGVGLVGVAARPWRALFRRAGGPQLQKAAFATLLVVAAAQPLWLVAKSDYILTRTDTRTVAKGWIDENVPDKSKVAIDTIYGFFLDPFYVPNLRKAMGMDDPEKGFFLEPWSKITTVAPSDDSEKFLADWREAGVDYLVTSSLVYGRYFSEATEEIRPDVIKVQRDYNFFDEQFELVYKIDPNLQPGPTIKVYKTRFE